MRISFGSKKNLGPRLIANALIRHGITWSKSRITILHGAVSFSCHKGITRQRHGKEQNPCKKKGRLQHVFEANQMLSVPHVTGFGWGGGSIFPFPRLSPQATAIPWGHGLMASSRYGLAKGKVVNGLKGIRILPFRRPRVVFLGKQNISPACQWHVLSEQERPAYL